MRWFCLSCSYSPPPLQAGGFVIKVWGLVISMIPMVSKHLFKHIRKLCRHKYLVDFQTWSSGVLGRIILNLPCMLNFTTINKTHHIPIYFRNVSWIYSTNCQFCIRYSYYLYSISSGPVISSSSWFADGMGWLNGWDGWK